MGIAAGLLGKFGASGVQDALINNVYDKHFTDPEIKDFEKFHVAFLKLHSELNSIMPGRHYDLPKIKEIQECHQEFIKYSVDSKSKRDQVIKLLKEQVKTSEINNGLMIAAGLVVPGAAMALKRAGENVPQVQKFRIHLVPDVAFVPTVTLLSLVGVKMLQVRNADKVTTKK